MEDPNINMVKKLKYINIKIFLNTIFLNITKVLQSQNPENQ